MRSLNVKEGDEIKTIIEGQFLRSASLEQFLDLRGALQEDEDFDQAIEFLDQAWQSWTIHRSPITDYRSPITDYRSPITDYRLPITDPTPPAPAPGPGRGDGWGLGQWPFPLLQARYAAVS